MCRLAFISSLFSLGCNTGSDVPSEPAAITEPKAGADPSLRIEHQPALTLGKQNLRLYNIECTGIRLVEAELIAVIDGQPHQLITASAQPKPHGVSRGQLLVLAPNDRAVPVDMKLTFGGTQKSYTVHGEWPPLPEELPIDDSGSAGILSSQTTVIHGRGLKERNSVDENLALPNQGGPDRLLITLRWEASHPD